MPAIILEVEEENREEAIDMFYSLLDEIYERGTRDTLTVEEMIEEN
jgi:hypothetical protein